MLQVNRAVSWDSLDEQQQKFITRVLMTIKLAKEALMELEPGQLIRIGNGYSGCRIDADYGSESQKWLLVHSEQATKRKKQRSIGT
ncbi:hypothetical protein RUL20_002010 [Vibrio parahaemolyticus]|nr:hypothetical protein [Vibrio parahaemolyticus]ELJ8844810.1 hypothetical protein [Vibrio parahaemolyticus]MBE4516593.1 hypothetical protein [Vibrio parahaemolyticus]